ncbi:tRNA (adenosine(37)-N6)-dimethylallyltransferase MiaA [Winogradskyella sp. KYW1333]|uniref:tRNA (adenosine(37)-N6)-dimethylallyltransferase MiaA n=1 Tax=unclassified Winogradskyella TaxID=2615021 RepID=UPI000DF230E3|nr:tRNA (adenosine(37)-N6)-dimethylallyltransferase MiaA [Winogradskyella sp. KYW1333]RCT54435.1 tRNA (adenosine(37)-N6)-dimethylallyltransferase MiaA [Winogradskyella sp. KYW1333]
MTKTLISIVGPTAIGKTSLSVLLAKHFNTEIISADSRQFYKEMNIGTAVPSEDELKAAPHHFIQHKSIKEKYSVGDFEKDAIETINQIHKYNPVVVMVGGSGLYVDAVTKGLDDFPKIDASIRENLNQQLKNKGLESLQNQLKELDGRSYDNIAIENPHRVIRALEICIGTGKPFSYFLTNKNKAREFKTIIIGLDAERELIYNRINQRVDIMIDNGLINEAKRLYRYRDLNALNTVGYKELFEFFDGNISLDFAISEIKKNTRRFAKRQLTWFRKNKEINWFDYTTNTNESIDFLENEIKKTS